MAFSVQPSGNWAGIDGNWSTFHLHVGTPEQLVEVLPSTSQSFAFVVLEQGCASNYPSDCATTRGGIFDPSDDTSWNGQQASGEEAYFVLPFTSEENLPNWTANGLIGFDSLFLDWSGDRAPGGPVPNQVVAGYAAPNPWLGMLGINAYDLHIFNATSSVSSLLGSMKDRGDVPSLFWGYTAGAPYADPPAFGSLTFGGYDAARVDMNTSLTVPFGVDTHQDLLVFVESIAIADAEGPTNVGGLQVYALIDSSVPEIWLPEEACASFEAALGLLWDDTAAVYFVNDTLHQQLLTTDPTIDLYLAASQSSPSKAVIPLPYSAFDLQLQFPLVGTQAGALRYFPLKRAVNATQYILGRTFLQEAYVTADYGKSLYTIGQDVFPNSQFAPELVTVDSSGNSTISSSNPNGLAGSKNIILHKGETVFTSGDIAGVAVGPVLGTALIAALVFWLWYRRRKRLRRRSEHGSQEKLDKPELEAMESSNRYELEEMGVGEMEATRAAGEADSKAVHEMNVDPVELEGTMPIEMGAVQSPTNDRDGV